MDFAELKSAIADRLDQGDRGDRGWFIITRVHVATHWLKGITDYLYQKAGKNPTFLSDLDYSRIARLAEISLVNPGVQLRRHHLLVMDTPLQLLERIEPPSWQNGVRLTPAGVELSMSTDIATVFEKILRRIEFAVIPWTPRNRVEEYSEFHIRAYEATIRVVGRCDGYVDRDEFDLFLSRLRADAEIDSTIETIFSYRALSPRERRELLREVEDRVPSSKTYQNWRDVGLHTFSLFSIGTSFIRQGTRLRLVGSWSREKSRSETVTGPASTKRREKAELRIPSVAAGELELPPAAPSANDGADAESFVAKVLRANGWKVHFYTHKRGYGFDLWAKKATEAFVIEVKSSLSRMGSITLTNDEHSAATKYRANYILAIVEGVSCADPTIKFIQNPVDKIGFTQTTTTSYTAPRNRWDAIV